MKYAINMQKYALHQISVQLYKYARNMHEICNYMQYMSSRNLYAEYAEICIPHFADGGGRWRSARGPGQDNHDGYRDY